MELNQKERKRLRVLPAPTAPLLSRVARAPATWGPPLSNTLPVRQVPLVGLDSRGHLWSGSCGPAPALSSPRGSRMVTVEMAGRGLR